MEMRKISSGRLRGLGYDEKRRCLRVELDDGSLLEYDGIAHEMWQRLSASTAPWSYYRDNIEEELTPRHVGTAGTGGTAKRNPLDDLFP
jgi:hypothetical protein